MATIKFVPTADSSVVSQYSRSTLAAILDSARLASCVITSTVRTPARQASAMYRNIEATSIQQQLRLYAEPGDQVIREYQLLKLAGHGRHVILDAMEAKIKEVGPGNVSKHCADPSKLNVMDVAPSSIESHQRFVRALEQAVAAGKVSKFLSPRNGDPAFHVEIPQPA